MKYIIITLWIMLASCGGKYGVEQSGEGSVKIDIAFTFINQLDELCRDTIFIEDYETTRLYNKAVAECVIDLLNVFDMSWLENLVEVK